MFKSTTLSSHLLRGVVGLACLVGGLSGPLPLWLAVPMILGGVLALRGCPTCWAVGLAEVLAQRRRHPAADCPTAPPVHTPTVIPSTRS